jgi:hypothetical protein
MIEVDSSTDDLLIEIQDELMHARFRFDALKLIFKSLDDKRAASACQEVLELASEKLGTVQVKLDALARRLLQNKEQP